MIFLIEFNIPGLAKLFLNLIFFFLYIENYFRYFCFFLIEAIILFLCPFQVLSFEFRWLLLKDSGLFRYYFFL